MFREREEVEKNPPNFFQQTFACYDLGLRLRLDLGISLVKGGIIKLF